jgi:trehalose 6-phosphate phosphatase
MVAVVSGRRSDEVSELLAVPGVRCYGLYGLEEVSPSGLGAILPHVEAVASSVAEAWVEDKGISLAVHYRQASDPAEARVTLVSALESVAASAGLDVVEGKMVIELVPAGRPMKGGAVEMLVEEQRFAAALFAGDDVADLDAFAALDRLARNGVITVKVAVRGEETPEKLIAAADLTVDGPGGLVGLLRQLA